MPVEIIAHRGASREHPENTLPAFRRALELGSDAIELDVHGTADGQLVIHHDPAYGAGRIPLAERTLAELRRETAEGALPLPTLPELLELVDARVQLYVEVKGAGLAQLVVELLRQYASWCAVHSFDHRIARDVHIAEPSIRTGILSSSYVLDPARELRSAGSNDYWQHHELVDSELVDVVHAAGGRIICWTVNESARMRELARIGVDGICTDLPGLARDVLGS